MYLQNIIFKIVKLNAYTTDLLINLKFCFQTIFFVWCFIPIHNNGSVVVYSKFIRPYFLKHQGDIDQAVNDLSEKGKRILIYA
jgi:receptor expression-enhancing protein 5/6